MCEEFILLLLALAAWKRLQLLKFLCRCATGKPVIQPRGRENDALELQIADVAGLACLNGWLVLVLCKRNPVRKNAKVSILPLTF